MSKKIKKVLVIEDSPISQQLNEKLLIRDGYQVIEAFDGEMGIRLAKSERPDAILLDIILPDMDGKNVAYALSEDDTTKSIPIIFTTNTLDPKKDKGNEVIEVHGKSYRAFAKPLHNNKLLSVLRKEINKRIYNNI